jgi:WD40 repeat protein
VRAVAVAELEGRPVVVSGSDDRTVRVWELDGGAPVGDPFTGHTGWVRAVAVAELEGRPVVVSGATDHAVRIWDLAKRRPVRRILRAVRLDHSAPVQTAALYSQGDHLLAIAGCTDGAILRWDLSSRRALARKQIFHGPAVNAVAVLGPDHVVFAASNTLNIASVSQDPAVVLAIDLDADVTALATYGGSTLVAATRLGLVVLDVPGGWPAGPKAATT